MRNHYNIIVKPLYICYNGFTNLNEKGGVWYNGNDGAEQSKTD